MTGLDGEISARSLIGGMELEAFNQTIRERRAAKFEAAMPRAQVERLFSVATLESLLGSGAVPMPAVDIFDGGHLRRIADVQKKSGKSGLTIVAETFRAGATIRVRDIDTSDPGLNQFVQRIRRDFAAKSQINVYLTPPAKAGFPPHFDITDVFVLQCSGSKQWRLFEDYANRIELPAMDTNWDPDRFTPAGDGELMTLVAGDVLYLPRGVLHAAACTTEASMHLTISIVSTTFADLVASALRQVTPADVAFRRRVPFSADGQGDAAQIAAQLKACLATLSDRVDVDALLTEERAAITSVESAPPSGELQAAIASLQHAGRAAAVA